MDGSPCFHQYLLWSRKMAKCFNFLPFFDAHQRQVFAKIALGDCLDITFYQSLHGNNEQIEEEQRNDERSMDVDMTLQVRYLIFCLPFQNCLMVQGNPKTLKPFKPVKFFGTIIFSITKPLNHLKKFWKTCKTWL